MTRAYLFYKILQMLKNGTGMVKVHFSMPVREDMWKVGLKLGSNFHSACVCVCVCSEVGVSLTGLSDLESLEEYHKHA